MSKTLHKMGFVLRLRYFPRFRNVYKKSWLTILGMKIGKQTNLPKLYITWPHQVSIGNYCQLESDIIFKYDGIWKPGPSIRIGDHTFIGASCEFNIRKHINIGNDCLIASGCKFIDHDHGISSTELIRKQHGKECEITIGNNVWLGVNVAVLKGVVIGDGSVIAAGSVVTKPIPCNEIWAGVPAKKIGERNK